MRTDLRGPTKRFRRHLGRQGNRRQLLSSAVAGGTHRRGGGDPSPISPVEVEEQPTPLGRLGPGHPPLRKTRSQDSRMKRDSLLGFQELVMASPE